MECSSTGSGTLVGDPILLKKMKSELLLTAKFDVQVDILTPLVIHGKYIAFKFHNRFL
jgi:hypothetical protein